MKTELNNSAIAIVSTEELLNIKDIHAQYFYIDRENDRVFAADTLFVDSYMSNGGMWSYRDEYVEVYAYLLSVQPNKFKVIRELRTISLANGNINKAHYANRRGIIDLGGCYGIVGYMTMKEARVISSFVDKRSRWDLDDWRELTKDPMWVTNLVKSQFCN